jgi:hypothetical protein
MGMYDHQIDEVRKTSRALDAASEEVLSLRERRQELFDIENAIRQYADRVDIKGYTLLSQIHRVIAWAESGKYAKTDA